MSGVQDVFTCQHCGHDEAFREYETRTAIEFGMCDNCGFSYKTNFYTGTTVERKPRGAYRVTRRQGFSTVGTFGKSMTEQRGRKVLGRQTRSRATSFVAFSTKGKGREWTWVVLKDTRMHAQRMQRVNAIKAGKKCQAYRISPELADKGKTMVRPQFTSERQPAVAFQTNVEGNDLPF